MTLERTRGVIKSKREGESMIKWKGVRPKYKTVEEVQERIDSYFKECMENGSYPTVTGLCYEMDINRETILRYKNLEDSEELKYIQDKEVRKGISHSIKKAYEYIQNGYEDKLINGKTQAIGTIFALKNNFKWVDKQEVEQTTKTINVDLED